MTYKQRKERVPYTIEHRMIELHPNDSIDGEPAYRNTVNQGQVRILFDLNEPFSVFPYLAFDYLCEDDNLEDIKIEVRTTPTDLFRIITQLKPIMIN